VLFEKGKLFKVPDYLVGKSWYSTITVCPACIKRVGEKMKADIDKMIAEAESLKTNKRVKRYYPKKKKVEWPRSRCAEFCDEPCYDPEYCTEY
jgi:hypothetical protein